MKRDNTFEYQVAFGNLCFSSIFKFQGGKTYYRYIGKTEDVKVEDVTYLDGSKAITPIRRSIYVFANERGEYKAFHESEIRNKQVVII